MYLNDLPEELMAWSPAEVMMLIDSSSRLPSLARVTFYDLVLREIVNVSKSERGDIRVKAGPKFNAERPAHHEYTLLEPLMNLPPRHDLSLKDLLNVAFKKTNTTRVYKEDNIYSNKMKRYFKTGFISEILNVVFNYRGVSDYGRQRAMLIIEALNELSRQSGNSITGYERELLTLRGNVLLLANCDAHLFEQLATYRTSTAGEIDGGGFYPGEAYSDTGSAVETLSGGEFGGAGAGGDFGGDEFDSSAESTGVDSGGEGGDGDSGCGGCGGCGGCS